MASDADGTPRISLDSNSSLRFIPDHNGRGEGLSEIDLETPRPAEILAEAERMQIPASDQAETLELGGVTFRLIATGSTPPSA